MSSNPFAALAKKSKKDKNKKENENGGKSNANAKAKMTPEQVKILEERKTAHLKLKEEKLKKKQCFFFSECGKLKDGEWEYCSSCYSTKKQNYTTPECVKMEKLNSEGQGTFHRFCKTCKQNNKEK